MQTHAIAAAISSPALRASFHAKLAEYEVPAQHRVYCATATCSAFLGSAEGRSAGASIACTACGAHTCTGCRKPAHADTCSANELVAEVRALARAEGWQTCPRCTAVVELHHGCNHMTCRCRAQFCYLCGVEWKDCACPQWTEDRLLDTAHMRVRNYVPEALRVQQPRVFAQHLQRAVEDLRVNHGCNPHSWRSGGGGVCEECQAHMPLFLNYCRGCNIRVCRRCRYNRM